MQSEKNDSPFSPSYLPTTSKDTSFNEALEVSSTGMDSGNSQFDSGSFPDKNKRGTLEYANFMFALYDKMAAAGFPNFTGVQILVPTNLNLKAWHEIPVTSDELRL